MTRTARPRRRIVGHPRVRCRPNSHRQATMDRFRDGLPRFRLSRYRHSRNRNPVRPCARASSFPFGYPHHDQREWPRRHRLGGLLHQMALDVGAVLRKLCRDLGLADAVQITDAPVELLQSILCCLSVALALVGLVLRHCLCSLCSRFVCQTATRNGRRYCDSHISRTSVQDADALIGTFVYVVRRLIAAGRPR